jgi:cbb3-type cytochrome oxidase subunit 1
MKSTATKFFATGAIFALCGMVWGIQMSATHDHTLSPAHGHLNLIGFVAMSVFGTYYALTPRAAVARLAMVHYGMTVATVLVLTPGIVMAITGQGEALAKLGSVLGVLSMMLFAFVVLRNGVGAADIGHAGTQPAE